MVGLEAEQRKPISYALQVKPISVTSAARLLLSQLHLSLVTGPIHPGILCLLGRQAAASNPTDAGARPLLLAAPRMPRFCSVSARER